MLKSNPLLYGPSCIPMDVKSVIPKTEYNQKTVFFNKNIKIHNKILNSLDLMNGNTDIFNSEINGKMNLSNGKTRILNSKTPNIRCHNQSILIKDTDVIGELYNMNNRNSTIRFGIIEPSTAIINSTIYDNIDIVNGHTKIAGSTINGDITTKKGNLIIGNSDIKGKIEIYNGALVTKNNHLNIVHLPINCLDLHGENTIEDLYLDFPRTSNYSHPSELIGRILANSGGKCCTNNLNPDFILKKGTILTGNVHFLDKYRNLIIEEGAKFFGKVINGTIIASNIKKLR